MRRRLISFVAGMLLMASCTASAQEYENTTMGIRMEVEDGIYIVDTDLCVGLEEYGLIDFANDTTIIGEMVVVSDESEAIMHLQEDLEEVAEAYGNKLSVAHENGYTYLLYVLDSEAEKLENMFEKAEFYQPEPVDLGEKETFTTVNLDGEEVTDAIFEEKDVTIINVWATWCNPCVNEMPELAAWEKELPDNVQLYYLCENVKTLEDEENVKIMEAVAEKAGIDRKHVLIMNDEDFLHIQRILTAYPTTVFIDRGGKIRPEMVVGAVMEDYKKTLEEILAEES